MQDLVAVGMKMPGIGLSGLQARHALVAEQPDLRLGAIEPGVARPQDIDTAMEPGYRHRIGPSRHTDPVDLDVRPGGIFHYAMDVDGKPAMFGRFRYQEVVAPEKLVFFSSFADEDGNLIRAPFSATFPMEVLNVWTLSEADGKTTLTLRGGPHEATDEEYAFYAGMFESMQQGFGGTFDKLDDYLATL